MLSSIDISVPLFICRRTELFKVQGARRSLLLGIVGLLFAFHIYSKSVFIPYHGQNVVRDFLISGMPVCSRIPAVRIAPPLLAPVSVCPIHWSIFIPNSVEELSILLNGTKIERKLRRNEVTERRAI